MQEGQSLDVPRTPAFDLPQGVDLTIRFGSHVSSLDLGTPEEFAASLKATDLFAPEAPGWDRTSLICYNKVAGGDLAMLRRLKAEDAPGQRAVYAKAMMEGLFWHGRGVRVVFLDVPESPLYQQVIGNIARQLRLQNKWLPFEQAVREVHALLVEGAIVSLRRENYILANFADVLRQAVTNNPKLRRRERVRVLALMGVYYQAMGTEISRRQAELDVPAFSYTEQVQPGCERSIAKEFADLCRQGVIPSLEMAARVYALNIVTGRYEFLDTEHNGERMTRIQAEVDDMSLDDIEKLYNESRELSRKRM